MKTTTTLIVLTALAAACGQKPATTSNVAATVDSSGYDVTVLQAWISTEDTAIGTSSVSDSILGAKFRLDPTRCRDIRRNTSSGSDGLYTYVETDCSEELERQAKLSGFDRSSPIINKSLHEYYLRHADNQILIRTGKCELVEFRTVTRNVALEAATFKGIGFHLAGYTTAGEFVAKERLHAVGQVTLKDGSPATVHRFFAQGMCFGLGGNGGSIYRRNYNFKPYAKYEADGNSYRVWDQVESNYFLGRRDEGNRPWVNSFDRQWELLKQ